MGAARQSSLLGIRSYLRGKFMPSSLPFVSAFHTHACASLAVLAVILSALPPWQPGLLSAPRTGRHDKDDSRDLPANAEPGLASAGRNKHHFRVPVIGRIRAQPTPWTTGTSAASRIITGRSPADSHGGPHLSPVPSSPHQGGHAGMAVGLSLSTPRKLLSILPVFGSGNKNSS